MNLDKTSDAVAVALFGVPWVVGLIGAAVLAPLVVAPMLALGKLVDAVEKKS